MFMKFCKLLQISNRFLPEFQQNSTIFTEFHGIFRFSVNWGRGGTEIHHRFSCFSGPFGVPGSRLPVAAVIRGATGRAGTFSKLDQIGRPAMAYRAPLSVVDDNRKVVGALPVVGAARSSKLCQNSNTIFLIF